MVAVLSSTSMASHKLRPVPRRHTTADTRPRPPLLRPGGTAKNRRSQLFLEPVTHPIKRFDHVEGVIGLLEFLAQTLDMAVDCTVVHIHLVVIGSVHQGI